MYKRPRLQNALLISEALKPQVFTNPHQAAYSDRPENTPLEGWGGVCKGGGGGYEIPAAGASNYKTTPPPLKDAFWPKNGEGQGHIYFSPGEMLSENMITKLGISHLRWIDARMR